MKKKLIVLSTVLVLFVMTVMAQATLTTIGTATYGGSNYNLIWDNDINMIWLDYNTSGDWNSLTSWANALESHLTYNVDSTYDVTWDPANSWDLPSIAILASLFGDIKNEGYDNFSTLPSIYSDRRYWSNSEYTATPNYHWTTTQYDPGMRVAKYDVLSYGGLAVRNGQVSLTPTPIPATILLFGSGLVGIFLKKRQYNL